MLETAKFFRLRVLARVRLFEKVYFSFDSIVSVRNTADYGPLKTNCLIGVTSRLVVVDPNGV